MFFYARQFFGPLPSIWKSKLYECRYFNERQKGLLIFLKGCHTFTRHVMQCLHIKKRNPRFIFEWQSVHWCS